MPNNNNNLQSLVYDFIKIFNYNELNTSYFFQKDHVASLYQLLYITLMMFHNAMSKFV